MNLFHLSAIATSSVLTGIALFLSTPSARAGEINITCTPRPGTTTNIALNAGDAVPLGQWSISDAVDVALAVQDECTSQGKPNKIAQSSRRIIKVNYSSSSPTPTVSKETVNSIPSKSGSLW